MQGNRCGGEGTLVLALSRMIHLSTCTGEAVSVDFSHEHEWNESQNKQMAGGYTFFSAFAEKGKSRIFLHFRPLFEHLIVLQSHLRARQWGELCDAAR